MGVTISLLRAVNVGGHNKIKMEELCALYATLKLRDARSYVQSGNVVFRSDERDLGKLGQKIENAIEKRFAVRTNVILRTTAEWRDVIARNPFAKRSEVQPNKLLVAFLQKDHGKEIRDKVLSIKTDPEELRMLGRELYIYFPNGMARPKMSWAAIERVLNTPGTGRNWNSVTKILEIAEQLEKGERWQRREESF